MEKKRVVVTGLGALTPRGNTVDTYWDNLLAGKSGADYITKFDASLFKTQFACEVKGFDPLDIMDRKEVRKLDLFSVYAMATTKEAFEDSKINLEVRFASFKLSLKISSDVFLIDSLLLKAKKGRILTELAWFGDQELEE